MNSLYSKNPFIRPQLFTDRNFSLGLFFVFVYGMLNVTPTVLLPTMLQDYVGYPDSDIGFILAMRSVGIFLGFWSLRNFLKSTLGTAWHWVYSQSAYRA